MLLLVAAVSAWGCVGDIGDESVITDEEGEGTPRRMSHNRMSHNRMSHNSLEVSAVVNQELTADSAKKLMATPEGFEFLSYAARVALAYGTGVAVMDPQGNTYKLKGLLGMAPAWLKRPLDKSEQAWLMGGLLAHVNAYGIQVPISVRAPNPYLGAPSAQEMADYGVDEGAFWGEFGNGEGGGSGGMRFYACWGDGLEKKCGKKSSTSLKYRVCARNDAECGNILTVVGSCRSACTYNKADRGHFDCKSPNVTSGPVREVTTTYLRSDLDIVCAED